MGRHADMQSPDDRPHLPPDWLLLDIETTPDGRLLDIGVMMGDTCIHTRACESSEVLAKLNRFSHDARCVVGHNIVAHDARILSEKMPSLHLLTLPVIDTLHLSPICFPEHPYHRLIKGYKLVAASRNDPVADARASGHVLADEIASLRGTRAVEPMVFSVLHGLLCSGPCAATLPGRGMNMVFREAGGGDPPDEATVLNGVRSLLDQWACQTAAKTISTADLVTADDRWIMAYALTWLRVAGGSSVLPPWVRRHHPNIGELLARLREVPCDLPGCAYCRAMHDPERQLATHFGFPAFRDTPADAAGRSLQREIVLAGMRQQSLLAILPTGGGKSICFQLPALIRNIRRGQLTIVISPLQALMKDQVDSLGRRGVHGNVAALNGLLTMPERADVLRRIYMGDLALLYVSPEQLRSRAFTHAVLQRDIGAWILDEAHCLSKWGHDFRPDYLFIGRCIRTIAQRQGAAIPPIGCFTATAKQDVLEEILDYFRRETGTELALYEGGVERGNLRFEVRTLGRQGKLAHMDELLHEHLDPPGGGGCAIVFRATQRDAEITAAFLTARGWSAAYFHAGLPPPDKKRIQDEFLDGTLRVICATNAFGMGVDKDDVRLVIHGDTPGSLENYLQEAGRAGRDRLDAHCVLLYDEEDCERQFRLGALSELSRRDILAILRGLRRLAKSRSSEVVEVTTGELLRDETVEVDFGAEDRSADTKVRAAIAWLERAGFVERNENQTQVIQARVMVATLAEAEERMAKLGLSRQEAGFWLAILREMMNADPDDLISVDQLGQLPEFQKLLAAQTGRAVRERSSREYLTAKIFKVLGAMTGVGLLKKDTLLSAFVRHKIADHSALRLARIEVIDRALLALLSEEAPDPEGWVMLDVRLVNQALVSREIDSSPEMVRRLLRSLGEDGRGFSGQAGSLELRYVAKDRCRVRLRRSWPQIAELAERRRRVARRILDHILQTIPDAAPARADHRTEFTYEALTRALDADPVLRSEVRDVEAAIERALMFLHEMDVIILQRGLAIFRSAMTIRLRPDAQGQRYSPEHYEALRHHYQERIFQVHVMNEYAKRGLERMQEALALVLAYFTTDKESFIARYFMHQREMLERATTAKSYRLIVDSLGNPDQQRIVTASRSRNLLVLAGPGSGKTRTVIHRCAYLLRVRRVRPEAILVCCFNHSAAVDLRRRLRALVGAEAGGVTVQTYHGLALRILGRSCASLAAPASGELDFDAMIREATAVLRGEREVVGLAGDEVRDRILSGYEHILVDEYQDIDEPQYELIAAITGRREREEDRRLVIMAVGDDDQNVYTFRGANVAFIRRFKEDYAADTTHLVENYRSTRYIIDAANRVIALNRDRMKTGHPIRIDQGRGMLPAGGRSAMRMR
jgi:ATP-dependent DNA helicase RecQ